MNTHLVWYSYEELDFMLNEIETESLHCEGFQDPIDGNGYAAVVTIVRNGKPGKVITSPDRYTTYQAAVRGAVRLAERVYPRAKIIKETSED